MDELKTILKLIAIILGALVLLAGIGLIYNLFTYALILGLVFVGGYIAFRLFSRTDAKQIPASDPRRKLEKVQRLLERYKQDDR